MPKLPKAAGSVTVTRPSGEKVTYKPGDEIDREDVPSVDSAVGGLDKSKEES